MSLRRVKVNGRKVWRARGAYQGLRRSTIRDSKEEARQAEGELLAALRAEHAKAETEGQRPATLRALLDAYAADLEGRGKSADIIGRAAATALAIARPEYRFPAGAFFQEDETRVRWLRPDGEITVLETMTSPFREIAKLAALTLMRMSEIRLLRREMVHLGRA